MSSRTGSPIPKENDDANRRVNFVFPPRDLAALEKRRPPVGSFLFGRNDRPASLDSLSPLLILNSGGVYAETTADSRKHRHSRNNRPAVDGPGGRDEPVPRVVRVRAAGRLRRQHHRALRSRQG